MLKDFNISASDKSERTSYLLCLHAEVGLWRVTVCPHHHHSHLEPGFSSSHFECYLLTRAGLFTAPLQRRLKAPNCSIKPLSGHAALGEESGYLAGLLSRYVHRVADEFSIRTDAVDGDTGLRGPGHAGRQRKRGGILGPSSQHQSSGANLEGQRLLSFHSKPEDLSTD